MKKNNLLKAAAFSLFTIFTSCREELNENYSEQNNLIEQGTVKDGRLYFPNKESLSATYQHLKKEKIEDVKTFIDSKGIESLVPIITDKNEVEVFNQLKSRKAEFLQSQSSLSMKNGSSGDIYDDLDDLEEVVGDDVYAAMLNGDAEIQVADKVYKYTDVGLFVTPVANYSNLGNYLQVNQISSNLLAPTDTAIKENFVTNKTPNQLITLPNTNSLINYYIAPMDDGLNDGGGYGGGTGGGGYGGGYGGGGSGGGSGGGTYVPPADPSMASIIQGLPIGEVRKPWLGNMFGTTWETDDKYEDRRRVKVKFYSQNLYLVYVVGCKVKHQYKGWTGLWRKENADKLGIGINSISWKFSHSITYASNSTPREVYWLDGKMYKAGAGTDYVNVGPATMPTFPFSNNATVDAVIQFTADFSGLSEAQLNSLFWNTAWKQANKFLEGQNKKLNRVAFVVDSYNSTYIQYYDFSQIEDNQDVIERIFNWGIATPQFTYTFGGGTGNGLSLTSYQFNFLQPTAVAVSLYGVAKKNGAWHGVKLNAQ